MATFNSNRKQCDAHNAGECKGVEVEKIDWSQWTTDHDLSISLIKWFVVYTLPYLNDAVVFSKVASI